MLEGEGSIRVEDAWIHHPWLPITPQGALLSVCMQATMSLFLPHPLHWSVPQPISLFLSLSFFSTLPLSSLSVSMLVHVIHFHCWWRCINFLSFWVKQHRSVLYQAHPNENMVEAAREAKQRLDDKFRSQRKSENKRYNKKEKKEQKLPFFFVFL